MTASYGHDDVTDADLTAWLDGELGAPEEVRVRDAVAASADVKARLELLGPRDLRLAGPFDLVLSAAPIERMTARFASVTAEPARSRAGVRWQPGWRSLAAALVLLVAGGLAGFLVAERFAPTEVAEGPNWRAVVADYVSLYTPETFAQIPSDPLLHAASLKSVGTKLGLDLDPEKVALPGLDLKGAILFEYDGRPLGQIAYLSPADGPVAFCIIKSTKADTPPAFEERSGKNMVFWTKGGRGYLVIGKVPRPSLETIAASLESRIS